MNKIKHIIIALAQFFIEVDQAATYGLSPVVKGLSPLKEEDM